MNIRCVDKCGCNCVFDRWDVIKINTPHIRFSIKAMDPLAWHPYGLVLVITVLSVTWGTCNKLLNMFSKSIGDATNASFLASIEFKWRRHNIMLCSACVQYIHLYVALDFVSPDLPLLLFDDVHPACSWGWWVINTAEGVLQTTDIVIPMKPCSKFFTSYDG